MTELAEAFTRKLGPLPAWAWGLGLGLGIVGVRAYKDRHSAATAVTAEAQAAADQQQPNTTEGAAGIGNYSPGSIGAYSIPAAAANAGGQAYLDPSAGSQAVGGPVDNTAWRTAAINKLIGLHYSPTAAAEAIETYLRGDPITEQQEAMLDVAIRSIGAPPDGAPPILRNPQTSSTPQPAQQPSMPSSVAAPITPAPPPPAPFQLPSYLRGIRFVKGAGPAVYQITPDGIEWVPSEAALAAAGGSFAANAPLDARVVNIGDTALRPLKRIGTLPPAGTDSSLG